VPGLSWADVSGESDWTDSGERLWHGLTVANTAKYSYSFTSARESQTVLALMVARGNPYTFTPHEMDQVGGGILYEDEGEQEFEYSLIPHIEGWREALTHRRAVELNRPLVVVTESAHAGKRPPVESMLSISHQNVVLGGLKAAETGKAMIARFYEAHGEATRGVTIECLGATWSADFKPMEIKIFRIPLEQPGEIEETDLLERPIRIRSSLSAEPATGEPRSLEPLERRAP
jgi:alpha-mannosidase